MGDIWKAPGLAADELSTEDHAHSLAFYRLWFDIGRTYPKIPSDQISDVIWNKRGESPIDPDSGQIIHPTARSMVCFAINAESDPLLASYGSGLQNLLPRSLRKFFKNNLRIVDGHSGILSAFCADANLVAHWANLGYVEEATIRDHILQSLISHPELYDHQADALIILFKLAGATFNAYADPSVVDRCFELLDRHSYNPPYPIWEGRYRVRYIPPRSNLIREVVELREREWEGLPPPPVFTSGKSKPTGVKQEDPAATPVATSLGLPSSDLKPQTPQPSPPKSVAASEADAVPESPLTPITQSPSISISTLSDFAVADASDNGSPTSSTFPDTSDNEPLIDPTAVVPHETFYLGDGNAEVLCGNTLFRVHTTILFFHSPEFRRMFTQINLDTAESPNGCPRILSTDTAKDFATLLKVIYLPGFPERNKVPDFATFSSLLRITAKYEMPAVRSQILEVVRDAYPETFEGLKPSRPLGESVFSGPTPHPNEVLNLFVQQKCTSALPMAYYMATRRGPNSLMDRHLPRNATLSPEILQSAITGLMALREVELNGTHRLIFGPKGSHSCSTSNCPSRAPTSPAALEAYQTVFDRVAGSPQFGTKVLQVPEFYNVYNGGNDVECVSPGICRNCVERWESGHAELRKKAWTMLPDVFGLKG